MRPGPVGRDLRARRFRHDLFANRCLPDRTTGKYEARCGPWQNSAVDVVARLMKLPNEPVELRRASQEHFAHDVDYLSMRRVNSASPTCAGSEQKLAILRRKDEAHRDALFRCGYR